MQGNTDLTAHALELRDAINESSQHVRNVFVVFILFSIYLSTIISSTTDKHLLLITPITLPILQTELPIVGFYKTIPWLYAILHLHIILQLYFLSRKLHHFNKAVESISSDSNHHKIHDFLFSFPFNHALSSVESAHIRRNFSLLLTWLVVIVMPLTILTWAMLGFLPYQDIHITHGHRIVILLDLIILWILIPAIVTPSNQMAAWWFRPMYYAAILLGKPVVRQRLKARGSFFLIACTITWFLVFTSALIPNEPIEDFLIAHTPEKWTTKDNSLFLTEAYFTNGPFYRSLNLNEETLIKEGSIDKSTKHILVNGNNTERQAAVNTISGLNLKDRYLRHADFSNSLMPSVDLRGAKLDGANFKGAILVGSKLNNYKDKKDENHQTSAINANFESAILHNSNFKLASLDKANFSFAKLRNSNLYDASLNSTNLSDMTIHESVLSFASLRGANLDSATIIGSSMIGADLTGATLNETQLIGTNLHSAKLLGADLFFSSIIGSNLDKANLAGSDLFEAIFIASTLNETDLSLSIRKGVTSHKLSQEKYARIIKQYLQAVTDPDQREEFFNHLINNIGLYTNFDKVKLSREELCNTHQIPLKQCTSIKNEQEFNFLHFLYRKNIACSNNKGNDVITRYVNMLTDSYALMVPQYGKADGEFTLRLKRSQEDIVFFANALLSCPHTVRAIPTKQIEKLKNLASSTKI